MEQSVYRVIPLRVTMSGEKPHSLHFELLTLGGSSAGILIFDESFEEK
jgi:hypothetical protein